MFGTGDFRRDLEILLYKIEHEPLAFSRFGDGEWYVCNNQPLRVDHDGWHTTGSSWLSPKLVASLEFDMPGYLVGISASCCQTFATDYFVQHMRTEWTYATIFSNANYPRAKAGLQELQKKTGAILVGPEAPDFRVPKNGVEDQWDLDSLVGRLLDVDVPIFICAGPVACVLVHQLWLRGNHKHSIIDVGATLSGAHRSFHNPSHPFASHVCSFTGSTKKLSKPREHARVRATSPGIIPNKHVRVKK